MKKSFFLALIGALLSGLSAFAQASPWAHLGDRTVNFHVESDSIHVGRDDGRFRSIRISVSDGDVHFIDLKVRFRNGDVYDIPIRSVIPAGGESRVIELPGRRRVISDVVFHYKTVADSSHRATVHLWGLR